MLLRSRVGVDRGVVQGRECSGVTGKGGKGVSEGDFGSLVHERKERKGSTRINELLCACGQAKSAAVK